MKKNSGDDEKNKLEKLIGKESWINFYKLQMKEAVFFNNVQMFCMTDPCILTSRSQGKS